MQRESDDQRSPATTTASSRSVPHSLRTSNNPAYETVQPNNEPHPNLPFLAY